MPSSRSTSTPPDGRKPKPRGPDGSGARGAARSVIDGHERRARRSRFLRWMIVLTAAVVIGVIAVVLVFQERSDIPADGNTPSSGNPYGGFELTSPTALTPAEPTSIEDLDVLPSLDAASVPPGLTADGQQGPVEVVAWVDANCVHCANFEAAYGEQIEQWLADGTITMEYRTVAYLDRNSATNYSSRAAAASACVADTSPESYLPFMTALFANYPNGELSDAELTSMAADAGADDAGTCIEDKTLRPWAAYGTEVAQKSGIEGTPTVYVDGVELTDLANLADAVTDARDAA